MDLVVLTVGRVEDRSHLTLVPGQFFFGMLGVRTMLVKYRVHLGHVKVGEADFALADSVLECGQVLRFRIAPIGQVERDLLVTQSIENRRRARVDSARFVQVACLGVFELWQKRKRHAVKLKIAGVAEHPLDRFADMVPDPATVGQRRWQDRQRREPPERRLGRVVDEKRKMVVLPRQLAGDYSRVAGRAVPENGPQRPFCYEHVVQKFVRFEYLVSERVDESKN